MKKNALDKLLDEISKKTGEPATLLRGLRAREGLTQIELSKKLNINQGNLSSMENGRRSISKNIAKRIEHLFKLDYRIFL